MTAVRTDAVNVDTSKPKVPASAVMPRASASDIPMKPSTMPVTATER
jgi:hypothetical protein